jgi:uncharacterized protein YhbP (UPF0306 family)
MMAIQRSRRRVGTARLKSLAARLLDASTLCAIATVSPSGRPHINTAYFAWSDGFELVWLSEPSATHSRNLRAKGAAAISVYDSNQQWGKADRGIQLFGSAREAIGAAARAAERTYAARFPDYRNAEFDAYCFYRFRPRQLKLFDEHVLGGGVFVTARVIEARLVWDRTEIYDSTS